MQINITELEPCKLSVEYEADVSTILNKRGEVLKQFKRAPVPGFRQGKASVEAIKVHYRSQIEESLKRALIEDAYHSTLFEKKIKPHGPPRINTAFLGDGKFTCSFELYTKPDITLSEYRGLEVPKPHSNFSEIELAEKMMQDLRVKAGTVTPYVEGDFVQRGDNIILNYDGLIDNQKNASLSGEAEMLTVGASQLTAFDDNLLGMTVGETREFDVVIPPTGLPSMVGKTIHFVTNLVMGSKNVPAPLDDSLAEKFGKKDFAELRSFIHTTAQTRIQEYFKNQLLEAVAIKLLDSNNFEVPNWMALSEAQYLAHQSKLDWSKLSDVDKEKYLELGAKNVKLSLILDKIRDVDPDANLSDTEVFDMIKQNVAKSKITTSFDDAIKEMNKTGYLQILMSRIKDEYALDFIVKNIKVIE